MVTTIDSSRYCLYVLVRWVKLNSWILEAACGDIEDPDIFFPQHGNTINSINAKKAKLICGRCPVRLECLKSAQPHGIWGGKTSVERSRHST